MDNNVFRKKSLERVAAPEQLNDYLKVCNPGLWMIVLATVLLLAGAIAWGFCGKLDTKLNAVAVSNDGIMTIYIKESDRESVANKTVHINDTTFTVGFDNISEQPVTVDENITEYARHIGNLERGEFVYTISVDTELADGVYTAVIITDSVSPMLFVIN